MDCLHSSYTKCGGGGGGKTTVNKCEIGMASGKKGPAFKIHESIQELLLGSGKFNDKDIVQLLRELPRKWERHGDLIIIPHDALRSECWKILGEEPYFRICKELKISRIARKNRVEPNVFRSPRVEMLWGDNGTVIHIDNKIKYQWDVTKCMFSIGNITEKLRIASFDCSDEIVVDLFAGIGYFVLPYLIHARAKYLHACEINPDSVQALNNNLKLNGVADRCSVYEGDNRVTCPSNIADRVNLGLIPTSESSWETACRALKDDSGGMLHIHANIDSAPSSSTVQDFKKENNKSDHIHSITEGINFKHVEWETWAKYAMNKIEQLLLQTKQREWNVSIRHLEHVKSYAPRVDHVVLDLECRPLVYN